MVKFPVQEFSAEPVVISKKYKPFTGESANPVKIQEHHGQSSLAAWHPQVIVRQSRSIV